MKKPDFFIVGAPRCATSSMNNYLRQHPEIFVADKEPHFFAKDHHAPYVIKDVKQYLELFSGVRNEKHIGEASVHYLYSKVAAFEIKRFCPKAKIIIMLRNPVDMLYSLHSHHLYGGGENISDFEEALDADEERKHRGHECGSRCFSGTYYSYKDMVSFTPYVKKYLNVFGYENVLTLIYDELRKNTRETYKGVLAFLGVNNDFLPDFSVRGKNRNIRNPRLQRYLMNLDSRSVVDRYRWSQPIIGIFVGLLRMINTDKNKRKPMSHELRRRLQMEFASEVESLGKLLGIDLRYWNQDA